MEKKQLISIVLLFIFVVAAVHILQFATLWDDAFITFRVVRNWVITGIPVYNIGYTEWVSTTFLWTVVLAFFNKITTLSIPVLSQWLGALIGLLTLLFMFLLNQKSNNRMTALLAIGLCAFSSLWAAWPLSGMETTLFTALITIAVLLVLIYLDQNEKKILILAGFVLGFAFLTRSEAIIVFIICLSYLLVMKKKYKDAGWFFIAFISIMLIGTIYLLVTFGSILPSSFYVKVNGLENIVNGKEYFKNVINTYNLFWFTPLLIFPWLKKKERCQSALLVLIFFIWTVYICIVGGDFMPNHRFFVPIWPLFTYYLALSINLLYEFLNEKLAVSKTVCIVCILTIILVLAVNFALPTFKGYSKNTFDSWTKEELDRKKIGLWLKNNYKSDTVIVVRPAGIIPYYSQMKSYDIYCLTNRETTKSAEYVQSHWVGHQYVNGSWIVKNEPDIVILDEHLYAMDQLPDISQGTGTIETQWRNTPESEYYQITRIEIEREKWLQYYRLSK